MKTVRFGVVGLGNMGKPHSTWCKENKGRDFTLGAVCDIDADKAGALGEQLKVPAYTDAQEMFDSGNIDAVIIATPHYWHAPLTIRAARAGLHVLCEKPLASRIGHARAMLAECKKRRRAFGVMLQHRSRAIMIKMKQLIEAGTIGEVFRLQLICSSWFRTQAYYDSGAWRGTWDGEGGGVLINQAPHHLDLFYWMGGLPKRILGLLGTRAHNIEVEDTANFLCDYGDGKVGYLYATTAEEPGMEQFTVIGDKGTIVCEGGKLKVGKVKIPISEHIHQSKTSTAGGGEQKVTWKEIKLPKNPGGKHVMLTKAFAQHLLKGTDMYATAEEGIHELELSNAMYLAGFTGKPVEFPLDAKAVDRLIAKLERERSTGKGGGMRKIADKDFQKLMKS